LDCFNLLKDLRWAKAEYQRIYARTLIGNAWVVKEPRIRHYIPELFGFHAKPRVGQINTDAYDRWTIFKEILQRMSDPRRNDENAARVEDATKYMADISHMCTGRAFFRTKKQCISLGPVGLAGAY
jgi:hypothetical protein